MSFDYLEPGDPWRGAAAAGGAFLLGEYAYKQYLKRTGRSDARELTKIATMTKRRRVSSEVAASYGETVHYRELARPWPRVQYKLLKDLPKMYAVNNASSVNGTSGTGKQASADVHTFFSNTDLQGIMSNVNAAVPNASTPVGTPANTTDCFIEKVHAEIHFTNSTQGTAMRLYIAYCKPRRDLDAAWSPNSSWATGLTDAGSTGTSVDIGVSPFMVSAFTENWKIVKLHSTILTPGATIVENIDLQRKRKLNNETLRAMASGASIYLKNWTTAIMVWFHGLPVEDNASTTTTAGNCKLLAYYKEQYQYSFIVNNRNVTSVANGLNAAQAATVANEITGTTASGAPV